LYRRHAQQPHPEGGEAMTAFTSCHVRRAGWLPGIWLAALAAGCGDDRPPVTTTEPITTIPGALCGGGQICTVAGTGIAGDGQDGLPARETRLYLPQDATVGPDGRVYVVDWNNHRIRVVAADRTMHVV